jgi:APA family basic amino acid/polyamine antiporter
VSWLVPWPPSSAWSSWCRLASTGLFTAGLALIVAVCLTSQDVDAARLDLSGDTTVWGVLRAAGLLFFAFAG